MRRKSRQTPEVAARCAAIPVRMREAEGLSWARGEFEWLSHHLDGDVLANLWFACAAHEFAAAVAASSLLSPEPKQEYLRFAGKSLLPVSKRAIQELISEKGMDGIWMDDSGVLTGLARRGRPNTALRTGLRLNALWYAALEVTGMALRGLTPWGRAAGHDIAKDAAGDHFERLAGRFRRAFTKGYWCETHQRVCSPSPSSFSPSPPSSPANATKGRGAVAAEATHATLPDAEQLLLMILPASPIPRTKQLGILTQIESQASGPLGVFILDVQGNRVESLLHRAWMAQGLGLDAETDAQRQRAIAAARPLEAVRQLAETTGVHAFYQDGKPVGKAPDPHVTAEVLATLRRFLGP